MTQAAGAIVGRNPPTALSRGRRSLILTTVVALHALALAALLGPAPLPMPRDKERSLITFDIMLPPLPPPPVASAVKPPPPRPAVEQEREERLAGGASPGRPAPAERTNDMAPPSSFEATFTADALLAPPLPEDGDGVVGINLAGAGGTGDGTGAGDGRGAGDGDGRRARWARATWIVRPSQRLIDDFWPERAKVNKTSGSVLLACIVPRPGKPERCEVLTERPAGEEFGVAAVRMSNLFRIRPVRRNGKAQPDIPVVVPVIFNHGVKSPAP